MHIVATNRASFDETKFTLFNVCSCKEAGYGARLALARAATTGALETARRRFRRLAAERGLNPKAPGLKRQE
jgi:hypothetical protein